MVVSSRLFALKLMGHAMVPVGGKIWEFVGPLEQGDADFIPWKVLRHGKVQSFLLLVLL